jgi:hypothetical protein
MKNSDQATDPLDGIKLAPERSEESLNERQYLDYRIGEACFRRF